MSEIIFEVQEAPERGYTARALGYSIFTEADTFDELREMARRRAHTLWRGPGSADRYAAARRLAPVFLQHRHEVVVTI